VPHCYPPEPDFSEERRAERVVWEALRDQLPDEASLFHSMQLKERGNEYEADLVVVWPGVGIGVIEVKGDRSATPTGSGARAAGLRDGTGSVIPSYRRRTLATFFTAT
jgi:hypothetical protein